MIAVGHMAAGYIVGNVVLSITNDPSTSLAAGFLTGIVSHYVLDYVPHGHFGVKAEYTRLTLNTLYIYIDVFGGGLLFLWLSYQKFGFSLNTLTLLVAVFGSILPDLISAIDKVFFGHALREGILKSESKFHNSTHWHGKGEKTLLLSIRDIWQFSLVLIAVLI